MSNLNKELELATKKIEAFKVSLKQMKQQYDEIGGVAANSFNNMNANTTTSLNNMLNQLREIKIQAQGIGSGSGLDILTEKANKITEKLDNIIRQYTYLYNHNNIAMPEIDNSTRQANEQAAHRQSIEATNQWQTKFTSIVKAAWGAITNTIKRAVSIIKAAHKAINNSIKITVGIFKIFKSTVQRIISLLGNFGNRLGSTAKQGNILKGSFTELRSKLQLLSGALDKIFNNNYINSGMKLLESIQTMNIIIGEDLTNSTIEWANTLEQGLGLSAAGLITDLKELHGVLYGLGMTAEDTNTAAKNLISVGNSLSTIIGYDTATVISKIESGMKGMTQSVDDLGLSVREAQMDSFLKDLKSQGGEFANIATSFSSLNEQQRVYVRYAAMMKQFMDKYDAETYAKSLQSITGRVSVLKNQFRSLTSTLGTIALNLFDKVVKPLTYMITVIQAKVESFAAWLNVKFSLNAGMNTTEEDKAAGNNIFDSVKESAESASKEVENVTEAINEAKGAIDSFDNVTSMSSNSGDNSSSDNFDYTSLMKMFDQQLSDQLAEYAATHNSYMQSVEDTFNNMLTNIKTSFEEWYKDVSGRDLDLGFNITSINSNWENIKTQLIRLTTNIKDTFGSLLVQALDDINIGKLITDAFEAGSVGIETFNNTLETIKPELDEFYTDHLKPIIESFGTKLHNSIQKSIEKIKEFNKALLAGEYDSDIDSKFDNIGKNFDKSVIVLKTLFTGETSVEDKVELGAKDSGFSKVNDVAKSIHIIFKSIASIIGDLLVAAGQWITTEGIEDISNMFNDIANFISTNKDAIVEIIKSITETQWTYIQTVIKVIETVLQTLVTNKDTVTNIMNNIQDILNWVQSHPKIIQAICVVILEVLEFITAHPIVSILLGIVGQLGGWLIKVELLKTALGTGTGVGLIGRLGNLATTIGTGAKGLVGRIGTLATSLGTKLSNAVSTAITAISNFVGAGGLGMIGSVLGGIVLPATTAIVAAKQTFGEGGYLDQAKEAWESGETAHSANAAKYRAQGYEWSLGWEQLENIANAVKEGYGGKLTYAQYIAEMSGLENRFRTEKNWSEEQVQENLDIVKKFLEPYIGLNSINNYVDANKNYIETTEKTTETLNKFNTSLSNFINNSSGTSIRSIRGFSNGGRPKAGSLFYANEDGKTELVGDFGGYTGVANQRMIIEAMQGAIGNSMYNAMTSAIQSNRSGGTGNTYEICKNGIFVGDEAAIRKLASLINNANISGNGNIANIGFSI